MRVMDKPLMVAGLIAAAICVANLNAYSISYQDIDEFDHHQVLNEINDVVHGEFDIAVGDAEGPITIGYGYVDEGTTYQDMAGFDPLTEQVITATAYFYFDDDRTDGYEVVAVDLGSIDDFIAPYEVGINNVLVGADAQLVVELNDDGKVSYSVRRTKGDFYFDYARLEIGNIGYKGKDPVNVPDTGSTLLLSGFTLLGLSAMRKRIVHG